MLSWRFKTRINNRLSTNWRQKKNVSEYTVDGEEQTGGGESDTPGGPGEDGGTGGLSDGTSGDVGGDSAGSEQQGDVGERQGEEDGLGGIPVPGDANEGRPRTSLRDSLGNTPGRDITNEHIGGLNPARGIVEETWNNCIRWLFELLVFATTVNQYRNTNDWGLDSRL